MQQMPQLSNAAFLRAKAGQTEALGKRLSTLVAPSRREAGCIDYHIFRSQDDPDEWFIFENWRSPEDFTAHMQTPYVKAFMDEALLLLDGEIEIRPFQMISPFTRPTSG